MQQITKWKSDDGKEFHTKAECKKYEDESTLYMRFESAFIYYIHGEERIDCDEARFAKWLKDNIEAINKLVGE